jgi:hypothetical protein
VPLLVSALRHLTVSRAEVAGLEKELVDLRNSRVQHVPPSAWVKREHKYKQDHEKFEHTIGMQRQRIAKLEAEVMVLREGGSIRPLEERIEVRRCAPTRGGGGDWPRAPPACQRRSQSACRLPAPSLTPAAALPPPPPRPRRSWSSS